MQPIVTETDRQKSTATNLSSKAAQYNFPKIIMGTSSLGNLYQALDFEQKLAIVKEGVKNSNGLAFFDSAGKYGAGLALESLGKCLKVMGVEQKDILISNKLGWIRKPLITDEPTFEPGVWKNLKFDAYQNISYHGILECYHQGNELLGGYKAKFLSVHDPDEYLNAATDAQNRQKRFNDILEAYRALSELKEKGEILAVGIGSKDWQIIKEIETKVDLDWVMFANSCTIYHHPKELLSFMEYLTGKNIPIINSAVFNGGFLIGSEYFNYHPVNRKDNFDLYQWRDSFYAICEKYKIKPALACVHFGLSIPGVKSIALNSSSPVRTGKNFELSKLKIPAEFWADMKSKGLIHHQYPYL
ncbi:MAG TPA: aldo/keto reductase [Pelobium sp.]